jgi:hypothetical protein
MLSQCIGIQALAKQMDFGYGRSVPLHEKEADMRKDQRSGKDNVGRNMEAPLAMSAHEAHASISETIDEVQAVASNSSHCIAIASHCSTTF